MYADTQFQVAIIKRQLQLMMPGILIFLDIDDLEDIGALETYVNQTTVMTFFLTSGYFLSRNCLREIRHTVAMKKPIVLVHEADVTKGGLSLEEVRKEAPVKLHAPVLDGRVVITWHRIAEFQLKSLKLHAQEMLRWTPQYMNLPAKIECFIPRELSAQKMTLPAPVVLYASPFNPGAQSVAAEICNALTRVSTTLVLPKAVEAALQQGLANNMNGRRRSTQKVARLVGLAAEGDATHMLLYLHSETWIGDAGDRIAAEIRAARASDFPICMVHENSRDLVRSNDPNPSVPITNLKYSTPPCR